MIAVASIAGQFAAGVGMTAAAIAVFGFLAHAPPALSDADEKKIRAATVRGGLAGLAISLAVGVLSAVVG
jgi:hypothetical protein